MGMGTVRLNVAAITADSLPVRPVRADLFDSGEMVSQAPFVVSRRDLLKAAGATALVSTGALSALTLEPLAYPEVGAKARVAWLRAGAHRAALDPSAFGGRPRLEITENGTWRAALTGALFPGTTLDAAMTLDVSGAGLASRLRVTHALGGFEADVPLADWLAGEVEASSFVNLSGLLVGLGAGAIALTGHARATLLPDWSMRLEAPGLAQFMLDGERLVADIVTIALAEAGSPSLLSRRVARRTLLTLESGTNTWSLAAPLSTPRGVLEFSAAAFDMMTVEAAETRAGARYHACVAQSAAGNRATYVPRGRAAARGAVPLELRDVRFARLLDGEGTFHVAARFASQGTWIRQAGRALLVGGTAWSPPFEMTASAGRVRISARPAIRSVLAPFEGALATPLTFPDESRAVLNLGDRTGSGGGSTNAILPPGGIIGPIIDTPIDLIPIIIPFGGSLTVVRPDDMLTLRFEFYNMTLSTDSKGVTRLVRESKDKIPYVAVRFPSQHTLEQAILDPQSVAAQLRTPLKSYLSDESRLVFRVSDSRIESGILYKLDGLLDWSGFTHHVVPAAKRVVSSGDLTAQMRAPFVGSVETGRVPETSLEVPWGLIVSPYEEEWWSHRKAAFTKRGRTELWHTRLRGGLFSTLLQDAPTNMQASAISPILIDPVIINPIPIEVLNPGDLTNVVLPGDVINPGLFVRETRPVLRAIWGRYYATRINSPNSTSISPIPSSGLFRNSFTDGTIPDPIPSGADVGGIGNRWSVIDLSARFRQEPIAVNRMMLTSLGAWLDSRGAWDIVAVKAAGKPVYGDVTQWDHRATMGRDQYVKVVKVGRIFPFGHRAVQITITERRVDPATGLAFLGQKSFIQIKEPTRTYAQEGERIKRRFPFKSIEFKTTSTPQIEARLVAGESNSSRGYWVKSVDTGSDFLFKLEGTDWDGSVRSFEMPLIFVYDSWASNYSPTFTPNNATAAPVLQRFANAVRGVSVQFRSQSVAFAKSAGAETAARVMPTNWLKFDAQVFSPATTVGDARYEPFMYQANVRLDAIEELTNQNAGTTIRIADIYQVRGYTGQNAQGKVFAEIVTPPSVGFPAELSGALATPIPKFSGISATKGTFGGDLDAFGEGSFSPGLFFDALNAKILGGVKLIDVLGSALGLDKMPVFEKVKDTIDTKTLVIRYDWETPVTEDAGIFLPQTNCKLKLYAEVRKSLEDGASPPTYLVRGELGSFKLHLVKGVFDAVILTFSKITFESKNGGAPSVDPKIVDVEFGGDLKYLAKLAEYLGALGGAAGGSSLAVREPGGLTSSATLVDAGPLKIDVTAAGVKASLTIAIPDLTIGVFSLKNMSFFAGLTLPFNGDPVTLDFAFCSRQSPFELLVMGFGGGGYVLMTFDPTGMKALEISLEFGAGTSFSIGGIASGSVEIKGGLSVRYERLDVGEKLDFVIFIRIHGSLKVMGIITVTLTFYLELRYQTFPKKSNPALKGDKLTGTATLTIKIEILFFTIPVKLSVTKELAGDDPRFGDLMPVQEDWDDYCEAFAQAKLGA
jgi:hypothetical protein